MPSERNGTRTRKVNVEARHCAALSEKSGVCSVQNCKDALRFQVLRRVSSDDRLAVAEIASRTKEDDAEKTKVKDGLQENGDREIGELRFGIARDAREAWGVYSLSRNVDASWKKAGV